jgi:hypothetical protein
LVQIIHISYFVLLKVPDISLELMKMLSVFHVWLPVKQKCKQQRVNAEKVTPEEK